MNALVPVSAGLLGDVEGYFAALTAYQHGDAAPTLRAGTEASHRSIANTARLVDELRAIRARQQEQLSMRKDSRAWDPLAYAYEQPVFTARLAAERLGATAEQRAASP